MTSEFNDVSLHNEIELFYTYYAPVDSGNTTYDLRLYNKDCVSHGLDSNVNTQYISVSNTNELYIRNQRNGGTDIDIGKNTNENFIEHPQIHLTGDGYNTEQTLKIPLDVHQDKVFESPYFQYHSGSHYTMADISFCARFIMYYDINNDGQFEIHRDDPYKEMEAVQFHETLVKLTFNLTQDFQVSNVELQKDAIIERSDSQRFKYELQVNHCEPNPDAAGASSSSNETYVDATGTRTITQSTILYICIALVNDSANIGIREMAQLEFVQPASQITSFAIYQRTANAITSESYWGDISLQRKRVVVSTRLILPFFDNKDPNMNDENKIDGSNYDGKSFTNVLAKGTVILMFQDDDATRRSMMSFSRDLQESGQEVDDYFEVELQLGSNESSTASNIVYSLAIISSVVLSIVKMM